MFCTEVSVFLYINSQEHLWLIGGCKAECGINYSKCITRLSRGEMDVNIVYCSYNLLLFLLCTKAVIGLFACQAALPFPYLSVHGNPASGISMQFPNTVPSNSDVHQALTLQKCCLSLTEGSVGQVGLSTQISLCLIADISVVLKAALGRNNMYSAALQQNGLTKAH